MIKKCITSNQYFTAAFIINKFNKRAKMALNWSPVWNYCCKSVTVNIAENLIKRGEKLQGVHTVNQTVVIKSLDNL